VRVTASARGVTVQQEPGAGIRSALDHQQGRARGQCLDPGHLGFLSGRLRLTFVEEVSPEDRGPFRSLFWGNAGPVVRGHLDSPHVAAESTGVVFAQRTASGLLADHDSPQLDAACSTGQPSINFWYASASSRPLTAAGSAGVISISQPSPYGSLLITSGASVTASLTAVTSPSTGANSSETLLVDSISPNGSPAVTVVPVSGRSTNTTSPN